MGRTLRTTGDGVVANLCSVLGFDDFNVVADYPCNLNFGDICTWSGTERL